MEVKEIQNILDTKFVELADEMEKKYSDISKVTDIEKQIAEVKDYQEKLNEKMVLQKASDGSAEDKDMKEYKEAFKNYLRSGKEIDMGLASSVVEKMYGKSKNSVQFGGNSGFIMDTKTLSVDSQPNGGYLVRSEVKPGMVQRVFETTPMRELADVQSISSSELEIILDDDEFASGGWVGEQGTRSSTDNGQIGKITIAVHEQCAEPKATQKFLDDASIDVESWISRRVNNILTRTENTSFVSGNGSLKPRGFVDYSAWSSAGVYERGKLEHINSGTNGDLTADGLIETQSSLLSEYDSNAVWMLNRMAFNKVKLLKDGQGNYLLNTEGMREGFAPRLLGKPVVFSSDMTAPSSFTTGTLAVAYGDFREAYQIVDRIGLNVIRDPYTSKPYVKFYTTKRVGGGAKNFQALKLNKLSA